MSKAKLYGALAALVFVVAGVGWYFGSPQWTLHQIRAAAERKDADAVAEYVDFPALRESAKEQIKAKISVEMAKSSGDGFAALGAAFAMNMVDGMVEGMLTKATLRDVFSHEPAGEDGMGKMTVRADNLTYHRNGFSEFELVNEQDKTGSSLVFKRDGLSWKLSELRMPRTE